MDIEQRTVGSVMILTIDGDILVNGKAATPIADKERSELQQGHTQFCLTWDACGAWTARALGKSFTRSPRCATGAAR